MKSTIEAPLGREHPHFRGVPTYFRGLAFDASYRRDGVYDYSICGQELARHSADMLEDGDEPGQDAQTRWDELQQLFQDWDDERVLAWYDREFPKCMALIPRRRRAQFLKGVLYAVEEGMV